MTNLFAFALLQLLAGGGEDPKPEPVRIDCRSEARLRGTEILLRDVADVTSVDKGLAERLADVSFGKRPAPGSFRALTREEIEKRLLALGLGTDRVLLLGSREIGLVPVFVPMQAKDLLEAADGVMSAALATEQAAGEVTFEAGAVAPIQVPPGRRSLDLRPTLRGGRFEIASAIVDVQILVDDEPWKTVPIAYRLRRFVEAVVVEKAIPKGQPFSDDNVSVRRIEAPSAAMPLLGKLAALEGKVAARNLTANRPLLASDLTGPAVVWRGDIVTLVSETGRVKLATKARADQEGPVGARILVTNLGSGKVLSAIVLGPGVVTATSR